MTDALTPRQLREVHTALRHLGRAMRALGRAQLPLGSSLPEGADRGALFEMNEGERAVGAASDHLIDGLEILHGDQSD